jgi:hypothetical protein
MREELAMKRIAIALLLLSFAAVASAQVPTIGVYFDEELTQTSKECMGVGVFDTLYVGARDYQMWVSTVEFRVQFGGFNLTPLSEVVEGGGLKLGTSYGPGTTITWPSQRNGYFPFIILRIPFIWQCDDCGTAKADDMIEILPHATTGGLYAIEYQTLRIVDSNGASSVSCGAVPTEPTSWSRIKAMYR